MSNEGRKATALRFLQLASVGDQAGAAALFTGHARHHNPNFAAGIPALLEAIEAAAAMAPDRVADVKRVIAENDLVVVHSHVRHQPQDAGVAVVHLFRFEGDLIAELWDLGNPVPANSVNHDGMF